LGQTDEKRGGGEISCKKRSATRCFHIPQGHHGLKPKGTEAGYYQWTPGGGLYSVKWFVRERQSRNEGKQATRTRKRNIIAQIGFITIKKETGKQNFDGEATVNGASPTSPEPSFAGNDKVKIKPQGDL